MSGQRRPSLPGRGASNRNTELGSLNTIILRLQELKETTIITSSATLTEQQAQTALLTSIDTAVTAIEGLLAKSNLYTLQTEADDLVETYSYLDAGDSTNRRINTIVYSSVALGISVTETFAYGGGAGDYYVTSSTLS